MSGPMDKDIKWMYDGTKSLVNREDYLLGKKIDKNLELFSDVIIKQKDDNKSELFQKTGSILHASNSSKTSVLDVGIVRTEDPLVALKLQQEQRKRQLLENPLLKMKAERILREAYEKEMGKKKHKSKKEKHRKRSKSSDSEKAKHKKKKKRHVSSSSDESSDDEETKHHKKESKRKPSVERQESRHHSSYRPSNHSSSRHATDSRNRSDSRNEKDYRNDRHQRRLEDSPKRKNFDRPTSSTQRDSSSRKRLSEKELEEKRQTMISNAKWRDDVRKDTIEMAAAKLRQEEEQLEEAQSNSLRPNFGNAATTSTSVAQRLQSKKHTLQRSHDCMERSFARR